MKVQQILSNLEKAQNPLTGKQKGYLNLLKLQNWKHVLLISTKIFRASIRTWKFALYSQKYIFKMGLSYALEVKSELYHKLRTGADPASKVKGGRYQ